MEARQLETLQGTYRTGIFPAVAVSAELEPVGVKTAGQSFFSSRADTEAGALTVEATAAAAASVAASPTPVPS